MKKISVIVPVYNVEKYLEKCLNSLVNQTLEDIEIIVVNDGSPDNSQKIIDKYVRKYPNKIISLVKKNGGQGSARNFGLQKAKGKYVSFVDADDWLDLTALELLYYEAEKGYDIVICDMIDHVSDKNMLYYDCTYFEHPYEKTTSACNKLFRKAVFENIIFYEGIWYEDLNFTTKVYSRTNKISVIHKGLYHCTVHQGSTMNNNNSIKNLDIIKSIEDMREFIMHDKKMDINAINEMYYYLVYTNILLGAINRVENQLNPQKRFVIKKLRQYCKENISDYRKHDFYKKFSLNNRIVTALNYIGLSWLSKCLINIKGKLRSFYDKGKCNSTGI